MNLAIRIIIFLALNFGALYLGNILQGEGPFSDWYQNLNIAPWTPPGWVFGAAWSTIMVCFSVYLGLLSEKVNWIILLPLFTLQFILNVAWNPVFFKYHQMLFGLFVIISLALVVVYITMKYRGIMKAKTLLMAPYVIWLFIAISLNAYALLNN